MLTSRSFVSALSLAFLLGSGAALAAGPADHQQCFKIKDSAPKATYIADLLPGDTAFPNALGCKITVPAKLLCIDVAKTNVAPAPPGADPGAAAQKSLCYKLKCPKIVPSVAVQDQFGSRTVQLKGSTLLCAPFPSPTTTTTTLPGSCTTAGDCTAPPNAQPACVASSCTLGSCNTGFSDCDAMAADGCEVNISADTSNCGTCGHICNLPNSTEGCSSGNCVISSCDAGYLDCNALASDGCEVNVTADPANCGGCNSVCILPNATEGCSAGNCTVSSCDAGYANCNALTADGCEVNVVSDTSNCGNCGHVCSTNHASTSCSAAACVVNSCNVGYADCDNNAINGCEIDTVNDPANCGSCGFACSGGTPNCSGSVCVP